jgi:hypothetical protein
MFNMPYNIPVTSLFEIEFATRLYDQGIRELGDLLVTPFMTGSETFSELAHSRLIAEELLEIKTELGKLGIYVEMPTDSWRSM